MTTPLYAMTDTWDDGGTVFTSIKMTITDTAYAAGSNMIDLTSTVAGGYFRVTPDGNLETSGSITANSIVSTVNTGVVATPGGGQGSAADLAGEVNVVTVVATLGDSVKLPTTVEGIKRVVVNTGAAQLDLFPNTGHSIDIGAADIPIQVSPNGTVTLIGISATNWRVL